MKSSWLPFVLALSACGTEPATPPAGTAPEDKTPPKPAVDVAKDVESAMDKTADPCTDFYQYACGGWLATTEIPGDRSNWTRSFSVIHERNLALLHEILETAKAETADAEVKKLGDFYGSCMDEDAIEKAGTAPLKPWLDEIAAAKDAAALMKEAGKISVIGGSPFLGMYIDGDSKNPKKSLLVVGQGGLGLPDRDYYLKDGEEDKKLRDEYLATMKKLMTRAGLDNVDARAAAVFALENELAKVQKPQDQLRDPVKTYNKIDRKGFTDAAPSVAWEQYFEGLGLGDRKDISVQDPQYIKALDPIISKLTPEQFQSYLSWELIHATAMLLDKETVNTSFDFFGKRLVGQKQLEDRWKRCVSSSDQSLGEILGKSYVQRTFAGDSKEKSLELINGIEGAFEANLTGLAWMDDATRQRAVEKMKKIRNKIGYPDKWRDYTALNVDRTSYFNSVVAARTFENNRQLAKVGADIDRNEWLMSPSMVNAYYDPLKNEIAFPAGILQTPFFDAGRPSALNYGGIGMVMGHEVTHGFDDSGAQYDGDGLLTEWWEPAVTTRFKEQTKCVADMYSTYEMPSVGMKVNGELTNGENIADMGGLKQSYQAWKKQAASHPEDPIAGLTNDQLFFVGFAQGWCTKATPQVERLRLTTDPHSPPRWRVNGPVSNNPDFAAAFQCKPGAAMNPEKQCTVW